MRIGYDRRIIVRMSVRERRCDDEVRIFQHENGVGQCRWVGSALCEREQDEHIIGNRDSLLLLAGVYESEFDCVCTKEEEMSQRECKGSGSITPRPGYPVHRPPGQDPRGTGTNRSTLYHVGH